MQRSSHARPLALLAALLLPALVPWTAACGGADAPGSSGGTEAVAEGRPTEAPDQEGRAAFLTLFGDDTLAMEWMAWEDGAVDVQALVRGSENLYADYHLAFGEDGTVTEWRAETWRGTDDSGDLLRSERLERTDDGAELVTVQGDDERRASVELAPGAVPFIDMLHWPFEASMRWQMEARGGLGEAVPVFTARRPMAFDLVENPDGTRQLVHPSRGPSTMAIDGQGRILWLDGTGSTRAYDLRRVPFDALHMPTLAEQFAGRPLGELSGRGEIDDVVAGVHFTGHYGEPLKRGRDIFGGLLAYGDWWRTGANQATHFSLDGDIVVDGEVIPAGDYTLSSIPEEDGGTLIINRMTGQGGQSYDPSMDQARVEMRRDRLDETVEAFEIRVVEADGGGRIELRWDDTVYWVPFTLP